MEDNSLKEICHHCKQRCIAVKLNSDTVENIDFYGVECLQDIDQAVYEGMSICNTCYEKEGGII